MRRTIAAIAFLGVLSPFAAAADIIPIGNDAVDPTVLHISSSGATGSDPVLLNSTASFTITNVSGQNIPAPTDIFFAVPNVGGTAPTINDVNGGAVTFSGPTLTAFSITSGQDLYTQIGCAPCDNSVSFTNMTGTLGGLGITGVTSFSIYEAILDAGLAGHATDTITGSFGVGTFIAPLALSDRTVFDTSYTNTGLVNDTTDVPEPASMLIFGVGLVGLGLIRRRRKN